MDIAGAYRRGEIIGRGNFGIVYKGHNIQTNKVVAIKILDLDTVYDEVADVQHEVSLLAQLSSQEHSNIIKYFGSTLQGSKLWIIMDLCAGGSVRTLLKAGPLEERYLSVICRELSMAIANIHSEGIIHRDIKAANVLITTSGELKLCDFGVAAQLSSRAKRTTIVGTPYWMAPEVAIEGASYNSKADIWSLGITMYEMITGNPPYSDQEAMRALLMISKSQPPRLEGPHYSAVLKDIVAVCLDEDPEARPSAEELLKHKLIKTWAKTPTSVLREIVTRYRVWKERNGNQRDSLVLPRGQHHAKQPSWATEQDEDDFIDEEDDDESIWDFDIGHDSHIIAGPSEAEDLSDAPDSLKELFGVQSQPHASHDMPPPMMLKRSATDFPLPGSEGRPPLGLGFNVGHHPVAPLHTPQVEQQALFHSQVPQVPQLEQQNQQHQHQQHQQYQQQLQQQQKLQQHQQQQYQPPQQLQQQQLQQKQQPQQHQPQAQAQPHLQQQPFQNSDENGVMQQLQPGAILNEEELVHQSTEPSSPLMSHSLQGSMTDLTPKFPHTQPLPTKKPSIGSVGSVSTPLASPRSPSPPKKSPVRRMAPSERKFALPHLVIPQRAVTDAAAVVQAHTFPEMPKIDLAMLLDSTPDHIVEEQLQKLLVTFSRAATSVAGLRASSRENSTGRIL